MLNTYHLVKESELRVHLSPLMVPNGGLYGGDMSHAFQIVGISGHQKIMIGGFYILADRELQKILSVK